MAKIFRFERNNKRKVESAMSGITQSTAFTTNSFFKSNEPEKLAQSLLEKHKISLLDYPINPVKLAIDEGITVDQFEDPKNRDILGIVQRKDEKISIHVNKKTSSSRKRFTIAHELGHALMHLDKSGRGFVDNKLTLYEVHEAFYSNEKYHEYKERINLEEEANRFALALLLPDSAIRNHWVISDGIEDTAREFGVSKKVVEIRLKSLGLID